MEELPANIIPIFHGMGIKYAGRVGQSDADLHIQPDYGCLRLLSLIKEKYGNNAMMEMHGLSETMSGISEWMLESKAMADIACQHMIKYNSPSAKASLSRVYAKAMNRGISFIDIKQGIEGNRSELLASLIA